MIANIATALADILTGVNVEVGEPALTTTAPPRVVLVPMHEQIRPIRRSNTPVEESKRLHERVATIAMHVFDTDENPRLQLGKTERLYNAALAALYHIAVNAHEVGVGTWNGGTVGAKGYSLNVLIDLVMAITDEPYTSALITSADEVEDNT